jgi:hypothetical protein
VIMSTQSFIRAQRHSSDADHSIGPGARNLSSRTQLSPKVCQSFYMRYPVGGMRLVEPFQPFLAIRNRNTRRADNRNQALDGEVDCATQGARPTVNMFECRRESLDEADCAFCCGYRIGSRNSSEFRRLLP